MTASTTRLRGHLRSVGTAAAVALLATSATIAPVGIRMVPAALAADPLAGCGLKPLDVELIIDRSGSMGETQWSTGGHVRLYWAKQAADDLVDSLDATGGVGGGSNLHHVGLSKFGNSSASVDLRARHVERLDGQVAHRCPDVVRQHAAPRGDGRRRRRHGRQP